MTTKIIAVVDGLGILIRFTLTPGQWAEITQARMLIEGLPFGALLADKAYDADHFRSFLKSKEIEAVIPARKRRRHPAAHDAASINGGMESKTSSRNSRNSNASPCGPAKPRKASRP